MSKKISTTISAILKNFLSHTVKLDNIYQVLSAILKNFLDTVRLSIISYQLRSASLNTFLNYLSEYIAYLKNVP